MKVTRTLLAPSEEEGIDMAEKAFSAIKEWDNDNGANTTISEYLSKEIFPGCVVEVIDSHLCIGGNGRKHFRIKYDYVTETDCITIHYPFER